MERRKAAQALAEHWDRQREKIEGIVPGAMLGDDPEDIHQLRVALRRIRAVLSILKPILTHETLALAGEMKWIAGVAGEVRDLDVLMERLWEIAAEAATDEEISGWQSDLQERRAEALERLQVALASDRFHAIWANPPLLVSDPFLDELANPLIRKRARAWRRAIKHAAQPVEFHAARKRAKQLRYAIEWLRPEAKKRLLILADIQDRLGVHHDLHVLRAFLEGRHAGLDARISSRMEKLERSSIKAAKRI